MVDALFGAPRLAQVYDLLDPDRRDLDAYLAMAEEFGASSVLDIGCGTGTFACLLAQRGTAVVGVDPAEASLAVARLKPGAGAVRWVHGEARAAPGLQVDLVTMTGNVAQVFVDDGQWQATLASARSALRPGGRLVFEARNPSRRAWQSWDRQGTWRRAQVPGAGAVESWVELTRVALPLVSFRTTFVFGADGAVLTSHSTLRFRDRAELTASLGEAGFQVDEVRDAPDRPGLEMVFVATRPHAAVRPGKTLSTAPLPPLRWRRPRRWGPKPRSSGTRSPGWAGQ